VQKRLELLEMQFGMLSKVGPGTCITWGVKMPHRKGHFWGVCLIENEKHCKAYDFRVR